jgi:hypothetical protein
MLRSSSKSRPKSDCENSISILCTILRDFGLVAMPYALGMAIADLVKSRARLEAEILLLRHQLNLALRLYRRPPMPLM